MATLKDLIVNGVTRFIGDVIGSKFKVDGGTSSQYMMANGTLSTVSDIIGSTASTVAAGNHTHGNIRNDGDITATAPTIASGDQIVINDNSASKITNGPTFDGSTTTKALSQAGTWVTYAGGTKVSLNGIDKGSSTATIYAPGGAGVNGQFVIANNDGIPIWNTDNFLIIRKVTSINGLAGSTTGGSENRTRITGNIGLIEDTELVDNLVISLKLPVAGVAAGITLNVNATGEHPLILNASTLMTTHYAVGSILLLSYDSTAKATIKNNGASQELIGCWKIADYNTNTTYSAGTAALLEAGTTETNRVWQAKILHNYIGSCLENYHEIRYGTCSTAAALEDKEATLSKGTFTAASAVPGARVTINFSNKNTARDVYITINGVSDACGQVSYKGNSLGDNSSLLSGVCDLIWDGLHWNLI